MSSGFVSGGTLEGRGSPPASATASTSASASASVSVSASAASAADPNSALGTNHSAWDQVQKEIAQEREQRAAERARAINGEERSLYDILQANKAAKQAAFEEQNRLRNQFRALDDDDVDFLDRVREAQRREDARMLHETRAGLEAFRDAQRKTVAQQAHADDAAAHGVGLDKGEWAVGRRKRKAKTQLARSVKRKPEDGGAGGEEAKEAVKAEEAEEAGEAAKTTETSKAAKLPESTKSLSKPVDSKPAKKAALVADYGSDSD